MHLSSSQIDATRQEVGHFRAAQTKEWLSGSRVRLQRGFSLVELIMTIVILGILAAVAVPRFFGDSAFQDRGAADQARAALRYGQKIAIAQHRNVQVTLSTAASSNCGSTLTAGNINCVISNRVTVSPPLPRTVQFDALGRPVPNAAASITVGGVLIAIEQETGYVH